jgi:two-component system chemotaxis response regulator CheB
VYGSVQSPRSSTGFDLVVIAGSLGAIALYRELLGRLPADLPAAVLVVQHRRVGTRDQLPELLARSSAMPVSALGLHDHLAPARLYVPAADHQTELVGPYETRGRPLAPEDHPQPPADPLLRTAAIHHGPRVLAVVLSGRLQDGAAGARAVKLAGGHVLAQHPDTAKAASMPQAALATGCVDLCLTPAQLGDAIAVLCGVPGAAQLFRGHPASWAPSVGA